MGLKLWPFAHHTYHGCCTDGAGGEAELNLVSLTTCTIMVIIDLQQEDLIVSGFHQFSGETATGG
jgi:hypothetical protein